MDDDKDILDDGTANLADLEEIIGDEVLPEEDTDEEALFTSPKDTDEEDEYEPDLADSYDDTYDI